MNAGDAGLGAIIAAIPALALLDPAGIEVRPLAGHTNRVLALDTAIGGFALRLPRTGAAATVDRMAEAETLRAVAGLGIAIPPIHLDPATGVMLTRREPGRAELDPTRLAREPVRLQALGRLLRRLHDAPIELPWIFRAVEVVEFQLAALDTVPPLVTALLELAARLDATRGRARPCHNDPNPGNILWQGARPWLIDWEFAGMNDPLFDLATVVVELDLDGAGRAALLSGWDGDHAAIRARLADQATLANGIAGLWYLGQAARSDDAMAADQARIRLDASAAALGVGA